MDEINLHSYVEANVDVIVTVANVSSRNQNYRGSLLSQFGVREALQFHLRMDGAKHLHNTISALPRSWFAPCPYLDVDLASGKKFYQYSSSFEAVKYAPWTQTSFYKGSRIQGD